MRPVADPLIDINLDDLLDALGLPALRGALPRMLRRPMVLRFTRIVRGFDDRVAASGLAAASAWVLEHLAGGLLVAGGAQVPSRRPLLVLANHPGLAGTACLFASLHTRPDVRDLPDQQARMLCNTGRAVPEAAAAEAPADAGKQPKQPKKAK